MNAIYTPVHKNITRRFLKRKAHQWYPESFGQNKIVIHRLLEHTEWLKWMASRPDEFTHKNIAFWFKIHNKTTENPKIAVTNIQMNSFNIINRWHTVSLRWRWRWRWRRTTIILLCFAFQVTYLMVLSVDSITDHNLTRYLNKHQLQYLIIFSLDINSNKKKKRLSPSNRWQIFFIILSNVFFLSVSRKEKAIKVVVCNFFFHINFNRQSLEEKKFKRDRKISILQIMYWAKEIKCAPHIFTLYLSIKNVLMCRR